MKHAAKILRSVLCLQPLYFMRSELFFQTSPWFISVCLIVGIGYAFLLYQPASTWGKRLNRLLAIVRALLIGLICFILLSPFVRTIHTRIDKAKVVIAVDNSLSIRGADQRNAMPQLKQMKEKLTAAGYEVSFASLSDQQTGRKDDTLKFDQRKTDLSGLLDKVRATHEDRNLTDVVLFSDGIVNQGVLPTYSSYPFKIHSLAVGDSVAKNDIRLQNVITNSIASVGNEFPIQSDVVAHGLAGKTTQISLKQGNKVISTQPIRIDRDDFFATYSFTASSAVKGIQHFTVEIGAVSGEYTQHNNRKELYIDILDSKQKILLLALAPHPDLKALRAIIERNENYELDVRVISAVDRLDVNIEKSYDLVILHQLPDKGNLGNEYVKKVFNSQVPVLFITGSQSALTSMASLSRTIQMTTSSGEFDKVLGQFNPNFQSLNLDPDKLKLLEKFPPIRVPFGDFRLAQGSEVILYQRIGSVPTSKPLLVVNTTIDRKVGVLLTEGIWLWRMEEFANTEKHEVIDELFEKVMQLLSVKEDKRKVRVYTVGSEFAEGDKVVFQTEIYNDIYERIYGQDVTLNIIDEKGVSKTYSFKNTLEKSRFDISGLEEGVYRYKASVEMKKGTETVTGQFIVRRVDLELLNTQADFNLMRELARKNSGYFSYLSNTQQLTDRLIRERPADRLESSEDMVELIHLKWLFFVILLLASVEWGIRKYNGSY